MRTVQQIMQEVRGQIIASKTSLAGGRAGTFKTKRLGFGYDFCQLRDYQAGDDVRFIDWKTSARAGKTLVREWRDEQARTLHILVDISDSMLYGVSSLRKYEVMLELATALALMGNQTGDSLSLHLVHNGLEKSLPAGTGNKQIARIVHELTHIKPGKRVTKLQSSFEHFLARFSKRSLVVIVSDFIDTAYETTLQLLAHKHEVLAIRVYDAQEKSVLSWCPALSLLDSESEEKFCIDSFSAVTYHQNYLESLYKQQKTIMQQAGITCIDCQTNGNHINQLLEGIGLYF